MKALINKILGNDGMGGREGGREGGRAGGRRGGVPVNISLESYKNRFFCVPFGYF